MFEKLTKIEGTSQSIYMLMEDISADSCKGVIEWILDCNFRDGGEGNERPDLMNLIICSHGGDVHAAFALIDIMKASSIPIRTIGTGIIASAGLFISMAGTPGMRVISPSSMIMSHHFSCAVEGNRYELKAQVKSYDIVHKIILNHYKKCTGLSDTEILNKLLSSTDNFLTASEAKKLNLCDVVKDLH